MSAPPLVRRARRLPLPLAVALAAAGLVALSTGSPARAGVEVVVTEATGTSGTVHTLTNHLVNLPELGGKTALAATSGAGKQFLLVWAGDANASDTTGADVKDLRPQANPVRITEIEAQDAAVGPDFLAVIDADPASKTYGKVVNTATVGPLVENEPHHMQYVWHKGDRIFAGGLYSDTTYVLDATKLPLLELAGVNEPQDTLCGSIPDAYWTLEDGTAYGTYMGGPDAPGPCVYTNGEVRIGNGFGGSPGSIVRIGKSGETLSEVPAALPTGEDPVRCVNYPALPQATCANPHGIQVREDLDRLVASDYAEPRNIVLDPVKPQDANIFRDTVRIFDISERDDAKLVSVSQMPDGPRRERNPGHEEPRGIMEVTVTNQPGHKGAFASSMCGGVIYYTPDITNPRPVWREVFDDTAAAKEVQPSLTEAGGCDGGGWVQTSPDDRFLYHAVIGRNPGALDATDQGMPKMTYVLDISKLVAAGTKTRCAIDTLPEVYDGGAEADCPTVASVLPITDGTTGGPHWGAPDNFDKLADGTYREAKTVKRIAVSNYFVARTGTDGNHRVCIATVSPTGELKLDSRFRDENEGTPCVTFNRTSWPHGDYGDAKPHSELFVVADGHLRK